MLSSHRFSALGKMNTGMGATQKGITQTSFTNYLKIYFAIWKIISKKNNEALTRRSASVDSRNLFLFLISENLFLTIHSDWSQLLECEYHVSFICLPSMCHESMSE